MISEINVGKSFPNQQFKMNGYKMFQRIEIGLEGGGGGGGGLMFYVNEQIPSKVLVLESIPIDIKLLLLEFTVKNRRWLCIGIYRLPSQNEKHFFDNLSKTLGKLTCQYDKTILIGDFT